MPERLINRPRRSHQRSTRRAKPLLRVGNLATPALLLFVAACLVFGGGSAPGIKVNGFLHLASIAMLAAVALSPRGFELQKLSWQFRALAALAAVLLIAHLLPLPPELWTKLPGRGAVAEGYDLLGLTAPWLPLTLEPSRGLSSALALLPGIAGGILLLKAGRRAYLPLAVLVVGFALLSIVLGIAQRVGGQGSALYFYAITNRGLPVGFFANSNHLATLLLLSMPLLTIAAVELKARKPQLQAGYVWGAYGTLLAFISTGVVIVGSVAGVLLMVPTLLACAALFGSSASQGSQRLVWIAGAGAILAAAAGIGLLGSNAPVLDTSLGAEEGDRLGMAQTSLEVAETYWPLGSGIGSFVPVYQTHEKLETVTNKFVNHAHNDYLELLVETGLPGMLLAALLLLWWALASWRAWSSAGEDRNWKRAASIAVGVVLGHSIVDYPARTAAIMVVLALSLTILARSDRRRPDAGS